MHTTNPTSSQSSTRSSLSRSAGRWMLTFAGFPLGGFAAHLIVGRVDGPTAALFGGLITGGILGAVQAWGLGRNRPPVRRWIAATAIGFAVGLVAGAAIVDYRTSVGALVVQGAVCGLAVGLAQALVLRVRLGALAWVWAPALAVIWPLGWAVTTAGGIQVDEQFTVFGSFGALTVAAITTVLPIVLDRQEASRS